MLVAKVQQKPQRKRRNANGLETQHSQKTFDSPSYRTLRRHKLILLEKQLAWAKEVASCPIYNPTRVLDPEYALCRGQRHLEVQRLEGFIAVQHRASLSEKERAEEVSFRLPELERLFCRRSFFSAPNGARLCGAEIEPEPGLSRISLLMSVLHSEN
ncbi:hypothetical protein BDZ45DRAFT_743632 [Acephala macrosclerotiorum]|nr:hypothetical protein BDZ45DRAFT_743632 [Acephala macrosclerotiorum]